MRAGCQLHAPAASPQGKTRYPLYRRLDGPQSQSEGVRKIPPPPGFDLRTVQPVASRYSDWATPIHPSVYSLIKSKFSREGDLVGSFIFQYLLVALRLPGNAYFFFLDLTSLPSLLLPLLQYVLQKAVPTQDATSPVRLPFFHFV